MTTVGFQWLHKRLWILRTKIATVEKINFDHQLSLFLSFFLSLFSLSLSLSLSVSISVVLSVSVCLCLCLSLSLSLSLFVSVSVCLCLSVSLYIYIYIYIYISYINHLSQHSKTRDSKYLAPIAEMVRPRHFLSQKLSHSCESKMNAQLILQMLTLQRTYQYWGLCFSILV